MTRYPGILVSLVLALLPVVAACSRDKSATPDTPVARASPTPPLQAITAVIGTPTPEPSPSPTATPTGTPVSATPTATPRLVNGLQIVDDPSTWVVREPGGLRIRSTPSVAPGNVVGSVPQNTEVQVQGRVLNGQEAEPGNGTVWLIVGPNQYMYGAPGSVERVR